jgi:predicted transcriptional regulator
LISQRPQSVNKDVLNQTECLFAFQMTGPQERKAIESWIAEKGLDTDIVGELPKLKVGEAYVWSPQWLQISEKVKIAPKKTADVSSTPKPGVKPVAPKQLSQIELEDLSDKMLATIERAKAEDPKALRAQLAAARKMIADQQRDLEKGSTKIKTAAATKPDPKQIIRATEVAKAQRALEAAMKFIVEITTKNFDASVPEDQVRSAIQSAVDASLKKVEAVFENRARNFADLKTKAGRLLAQMKAIIESDVTAKVEVRHNEPFTVAPTSPRQLPRAPRATVAASGDVNLGTGERRCAIAIAQHQPNGCAREQLTTLTGFKRSTRNTYLQRLLAAGLVMQSGERFIITDAGIDWIGSGYEPLPTGVALQEYWLNKLPQGESAVLRVVLENAAGIDRESIGDKTAFKRSTRNTYIQRLAARELVKVSGENIQPSDSLFA